MPRALLISVLVMMSCALAAQTPGAKPAAPAQTKPAKPSAPAPPSSAPANGALDKVLTRMDAAAASFRTIQADFLWDQYMKVVNEHDNQKGVVYFRRSGKEIEMLADIARHNDVADQKHVLFTGSKVRVYQPNIDVVTEYNAGKNRAEFESFLVLGFGGRGHDLLKSFDVHYAGAENVGGVSAAKLELAPKAERVRNLFNRIVLWIDPARGVSVQQQFFDDRSGDYRLAKYSNIRMNENIPDSVFKLKTTRKTKIVTPQG